MPYRRGRPGPRASPGTRLMLRHVLPNSLDVLIVKWGADIGSTMLVISAPVVRRRRAAAAEPRVGRDGHRGPGLHRHRLVGAVFPGVAIAVVDGRLRAARRRAAGPPARREAVMS